MAISVTAFDIAQRFIGVTEVNGATSNPQVLAMLRLDNPSVADDEVPWCSAFANYVAWLLRLPRSKSLMARSWLAVGRAVSIQEAQVGFDVVILKRGLGEQLGPEVLNAPGHVGFFAGWQDGKIMLLSGNHSNLVGVSSYPVEQILGVRRLMA